jgi:hypothetical protein
MAEDKVEQISGIIGDPKSWGIAEQTGELVLVELRPGAFIKMRKSEAIAKGLWKEPKQEAGGKKQEARGKMRRPLADKMRRPGDDKGSK